MPIGDPVTWRTSSPSSTAMPQHAEHESDDLAHRQRLVQQRHAEQHGPDRHRVRQDRGPAGGHLLDAEKDQPVPCRDVEQRQREDLAPMLARYPRSNRPTAAPPATSRCAANGSVAPRKVSGASSVTPSFSTGQLHPQTSVRYARPEKTPRPEHAARPDELKSSDGRACGDSWTPPVRAQAGGASPYLA